MKVVWIIFCLAVLVSCGGGNNFSEFKGTDYYILPTTTEFKMVVTPNLAGKKFPYYDRIITFAEVPTAVPASFMMAETETTYELWKEVYDWALIHGYSFANPGTNGWNNNLSSEMDKSVSKQYPVTSVNWRDAMVWCNALTEYYNEFNLISAKDLRCVYYSDSSYFFPIKVSTSNMIFDLNNGSEDSPYIYSSFAGNIDMTFCTADGFRLPTDIEWEFSARYRGNDSANAVLMDGIYYTNNDSASGADADVNNTDVTSLYAVYSVNSGNTSAVVKTKLPNALGLYDMSGNGIEWIFDAYLLSSRWQRNGGFSGNQHNISILSNATNEPYSIFYLYGFRFCRSK